MKPGNIINRDPPELIEVRRELDVRPSTWLPHDTRTTAVRGPRRAVTESNFTLPELLRVLALAGFGAIVFLVWSLRIGIKWFFNKAVRSENKRSGYAGRRAN